jgi:hypothetical protein
MPATQAVCFHAEESVIPYVIRNGGSGILLVVQHVCTFIGDCVHMMACGHFFGFLQVSEVNAVCPELCMNKFLCVTFHGPNYVIVYTFYNICYVTGLASNKHEDYLESNLRSAVNKTRNERNYCI